MDWNDVHFGTTSSTELCSRILAIRIQDDQLEQLQHLDDTKDAPFVVASAMWFPFLTKPHLCYKASLGNKCSPPGLKVFARGERDDHFGRSK